MVIVIKMVDDIVQQARYSTYGCPAAQACGQFVCDEIEGKPVSEIYKIDEDYILKGVGQMPLGREHCPGLAVGALESARAQIESSFEQKEH